MSRLFKPSSQLTRQGSIGDTNSNTSVYAGNPHGCWVPVI